MYTPYYFRLIIIVLILETLSESLDHYKLFTNDPLDYLEKRYGPFPESLRLQMLDKSKEMFYFGYDNYLQHAFPMDELNPILCNGRGPDYGDP